MEMEDFILWPLPLLSFHILILFKYSFIHSFIHLFNEYFLSIYYVWDTVLNIEKKACLRETSILDLMHL